MEFTLFGRQTIMILAVGAAICVSAGSWLRLRHGARRGRLDGFLIYFGYLLFVLSIVSFIAAGFVNG